MAHEQGVHPFANQYVPHQKRYESGWVDFPNYLMRSSQSQTQGKAEDAAMEQAGLQAAQEAGKSLPFDYRYNEIAYQETVQQVAETSDYFVSFKERAQERGEQKHRREALQAWQSHYSRKPFQPSTVPSALKGMDRTPASKYTVPYQQLEAQLTPNKEDLLLFVAEESPLMDVETMGKKDSSTQLKKPTASSPKQRKASTSKAGSTSENPSSGTPFGSQQHSPVKQATNSSNNRKGMTPVPYQPAFQRPQTTKQMQFQQETLVPDIPAVQNLEPLAQLKPLPGKQRRAMNRSLSWIMEQEQGASEVLPYSDTNTKRP